MCAALYINTFPIPTSQLHCLTHLPPPPSQKQGRLQVCWPTTPLIVAAKMGHTDMVALLMDRGAGIAGVSKVSCGCGIVRLHVSGSLTDWRLHDSQLLLRTSTCEAAVLVHHPR